MKKVRIEPLCLNGGPTFPYGSGLKAIKQFGTEAVQFSQQEVTTFEKLLEVYGKNNRLRAGEYYNGYVVIFHFTGYAELVRMRGFFRKVSPDDAQCMTGKLAEDIRAGRLWECMFPLEGERETNGSLERILTIKDCQFRRLVSVSPECAIEFEKSLQEKLLKAQMSEEKLAELDDDELSVLQNFFGEYYGKFFVEVNF